MLQVPAEDISTWITPFLWPLFRISSLFMVMPIIGAQMVPARVRLAMALAVTIMLMPMLPDMPKVDPFSLSAWLINLQQVLIGTLMGFALQVFFHLFAMAGQMIAMQMGLGFASMNDPANGVTVTVLGQFYLVMTTLLFLAVNGHLVVIEVLVESFHTLPVSEGFLLPEGSIERLVLWFSWIFSSAMLIAIPGMTALLIVNLTFGVMTKAAPQLNIFSLGFPMALIFGLFIVWITVTGFLDQYLTFSEQALLFLRDLVTQ